MTNPTARAGLRVRGIDTALADRIRATLADDFGNTLHVWTNDAPRSNPCRHCLRLTDPGEDLILFALCPFDTTGPYAEAGPVFVHANPCEPYAAYDRFPPDFLERSLTLRAYDAEGRIRDAEVAPPGGSGVALDRLFVDERVLFVHVRNPAWGCYDVRVDRA